jgi:hypothetical protein
LVLRDLDVAQRYFGQVRARCFHVSVLGAIPFRDTRAFPYMHRALDAADRALMRAIRPSAPGPGSWSCSSQSRAYTPRDHELRAAAVQVS